VPLNPAIRNKAKTASIVPEPENQIPFRDLLKIANPMPYKTAITPVKNMKVQQASVQDYACI